MPALVLLLALGLAGCAAPIFPALGVLGNLVGVYQRHEDRQAQIDQTAEIKKLREAIEARWPELTPTDR